MLVLGVAEKLVLGVAEMLVLGLGVRALAGAGAIGLVEARTLESHAANTKYLGQFALAVRALGQSLVADGLLHVESVGAVLALV